MSALALVHAEAGFVLAQFCRFDDVKYGGHK